ncbi:MAG: PhzF family phenazine biosynthesis protein [Gammaproteobacteria bacterium]
MELQYYQVNAFTTKFSGGNPAGVCPLPDWLPDKLMQAVARENDLSETAFFVKNGNEFDLRWFTPSVEVDLCGHATLASAHVLFHEMNHAAEEIVFNTRSGALIVGKHGNDYVMEMPVIKANTTSVPDNLINGLGRRPGEAYQADDYLLVYDDEVFIAELEPDFSLIQDIERRGTIVTAPSSEEGVDFVSRFFGSAAVGIDEDPATGSAHCMLTPYWSKRLSKAELVAKQLSSRGADFKCQLADNKVFISGQAVTYIKGNLYID